MLGLGYTFIIVGIIGLSVSGGLTIIVIAAGVLMVASYRPPNLTKKTRSIIHTEKYVETKWYKS